MDARRCRDGEVWVVVGLVAAVVVDIMQVVLEVVVVDVEGDVVEAEIWIMMILELGVVVVVVVFIAYHHLLRYPWVPMVLPSINIRFSTSYHRHRNLGCIHFRTDPRSRQLEHRLSSETLVEEGEYQQGHRVEELQDRAMRLDATRNRAGSKGSLMVVVSAVVS
ncbi:hypothetical protein K457DRAFT_670623 [Linnemannia elongata AG-77]|uniref:Uncharacterized protein n=1 Tax=Linnemannia elongata AG-77 TaxID=1314771 RepID=A0A197JNR1_9FUNG|nr:hypothetical protein K457DRAFT_670623 [Linnemannia elongata AG-77]